MFSTHHLCLISLESFVLYAITLTHSHTMTPFDAPGKQAFENTVGKGEIARNEQFLLFPQCFLKACFPGASKGVIVWEWVKEFC